MPSRSDSASTVSAASGEASSSAVTVSRTERAPSPTVCGDTERLMVVDGTSSSVTVTVCSVSQSDASKVRLDGSTVTSRLPDTVNHVARFDASLRGYGILPVMISRCTLRQSSVVGSPVGVIPMSPSNAWMARFVCGP